MCRESLLLVNAQTYAQRNGRQLLSKVGLGRGTDGSVWRSTKPSAIKAIWERKNYEDEIECYRRLQAANVHNLCDFAVPRLFGFDNELKVIEMSIVQAPYLLDFGKVYLDRPPTDVYDQRQLAAAEAEAKALFGATWPDVSALLFTLRDRFGIWYVDPKPANIDCGVVNDPDWDKETGVDYSEYDDEAVEE
jgi:hypothetical protein